jgi:hypothetical protein
MSSICGGSSTWGPLLFASSIDGFCGFLSMPNRKGRSDGAFGGRMLLKMISSWLSPCKTWRGR